MHQDSLSVIGVDCRFARFCIAMSGARASDSEPIELRLLRALQAGLPELRKVIARPKRELLLIIADLNKAALSDLQIAYQMPNESSRANS